VPLLHADRVPAGVVFTATTRTESTNVRLPPFADSTVRGWVEGDRGKVEFLRSRNPATPAGSVLLTTDGARTVRFFDPAAKTCRNWVPLGILGSPRSTTYEALRVEKLLDEPGPELVGSPTRHYRFVASYETRTGGAGASGTSRTEVVEDIWTDPALSEPALEIWLTKGRPSVGADELERRITRAMAEVRGVPLKRITSLKVTPGGGGHERSVTTTLEVTSLARENVPASTFAEPFPCKIRKVEDRR
jgi:hypothetical protein